jgi:hypothetical protein
MFQDFITKSTAAEECSRPPSQTNESTFSNVRVLFAGRWHSAHRHAGAYENVPLAVVAVTPWQLTRLRPLLLPTRSTCINVCINGAICCCCCCSGALATASLLACYTAPLTQVGGPSSKSSSMNSIAKTLGGTLGTFCTKQQHPGAIELNKKTKQMDCYQHEQHRIRETGSYAKRLCLTSSVGLWEGPLGGSVRAPPWWGQFVICNL